MTLSILIFILLFVLLAIGLPIGFAMAVTGFLGSAMLIDFNAAMALLGQTAFETPITYNLSIVPLFILMGYFASNSGLSEALFSACNTWLGSRRGGLALATIGGCGAFAAICGSSLATAATMTQVALPEMKRFNYDDSLATGSIAAGGTIGILIPPSVILVLYGILTESNIGELFLAGFIPGILTVIFFMTTILIVTAIYPETGPRGAKTTFAQKMGAFKKVWSTMLLFLLVIGGIYLGIFSPEEAAGIGASGALALALMARTMTWDIFFDCLMETVKTSAMIFTILIGAILFNNFLVLSAVPDSIGAWIGGLDMSPTAILIIILLIYLVLGCALDSLAMILLTIPIFFPVVAKLGFDPIWFGIIVVMVVELGLITPPIGMNVFIIKGMAPEVPLGTIYKGVLPFAIAQIMLIALIVIFPAIATWLPSTMSQFQ
ncbi:MAG: TRAP transporter large permease [Rhodospirillaceae bacterium]|nr:TRAP transporter large permease [Rhodospirillaceae bacterium]MBT4115955.1 TRAP transporter large permease [Rhodospirillaceae bacterium]MBT4673692.1 TRAP transporter large permease [Rhodospirillaceae bacterium]MBT4721482.1 TRAP transporter large permease [Rhodospirillaceae bacterium]MBT4749087.1 TRAP transporter large permease [Rhodospirillaceae bacterium]